MTCTSTDRALPGLLEKLATAIEEEEERLIRDKIPWWRRGDIISPAFEIAALAGAGVSAENLRRLMREQKELHGIDPDTPITQMSPEPLSKRQMANMGERAGFRTAVMPKQSLDPADVYWGSSAKQDPELILRSTEHLGEPRVTVHPGVEATKPGGKRVRFTLMEASPYHLPENYAKSLARLNMHQGRAGKALRATSAVRSALDKPALRIARAPALFLAGTLGPEDSSLAAYGIPLAGLGLHLPDIVEEGVAGRRAMKILGDDLPEEVVDSARRRTRLKLLGTIGAGLGTAAIPALGRLRRQILSTTSSPTLPLAALHEREQEDLKRLGALKREDDE